MKRTIFIVKNICSDERSRKMEQLFKSVITLKLVLFVLM